MRGVVGEICTNQRALTVVKVFLQGVGGREKGMGWKIECCKRRQKKKRLSPFFLFGVAIERAGDQVVNTCSASKYDSLLPSTFNSRTRDCMVFLVGLLESA